METVRVVGPAYPPDALAGGNVVAVLRVSAGSVGGVDILQGDEPFTNPVRSALSRWRFKGSDNGRFLVVVNFRTPAVYSTGSPVRDIASAQQTPGLAYPRNVVEPPYPPNSMAEGSVVLHLDISETGFVAKVKVVQGLGNLTGACAATVRKWQFNPARDKSGNAAPSEAYAVFVVRRPVLNAGVGQVGNLQHGNVVRAAAPCDKRANLLSDHE